jgi:hypothetical protein
MRRSIYLCTVMLGGLCMLLGPGAFAQTTLAPDQYVLNNTQAAARHLGNQSQNVPNIIHANLHRTAGNVTRTYSEPLHREVRSCEA